MSAYTTQRFRFLASLCGCAALATSACGSDDGSGKGPNQYSEPLYALSTLIFDDTAASAYVAFMDSLDGRTVSLATSEEFAGWSSIAVQDGALFVGSGDAAELTRYDVSDSGQLGNERTLNFADYGLSSVSFSFNAFVDEARAHLSLEETARVVWDHRELSVSGTTEAPQVARQRDNLQVSAANFEGVAVRNGEVLWPYFWRDADWYAFHQQSQIAVYDAAGGVRKLIDAPCPALNIATQDEQGNVYFSGMVDTLAHQLLAPQSSLQRCVVRINAGEDEIAEGWPRRFEELTGGRPAGRFYYLRDGKGLLTVFHQERATLDPEDASSIFADHWGLWLVDLNAWQAAPIEAWGFTSSNVLFSKVDGRAFLHVVKSDFSETTLHEVAVDGRTTPQITAPGYVSVLVKLR
jgi:hypothetical protein